MATKTEELVTLVGELKELSDAYISGEGEFEAAKEKGLSVREAVQGVMKELRQKRREDYTKEAKENIKK
jgi:hypothetical protein